MLAGNSRFTLRISRKIFRRGNFLWGKKALRYFITREWRWLISIYSLFVSNLGWLDLVGLLTLVRRINLARLLHLVGLLTLVRRINLARLLHQARLLTLVRRINLVRLLHLARLLTLVRRIYLVRLLHLAGLINLERIIIRVIILQDLVLMGLHVWLSIGVSDLVPSNHLLLRKLNWRRILVNILRVGLLGRNIMGLISIFSVGSKNSSLGIHEFWLIFTRVIGLIRRVIGLTRRVKTVFMQVSCFMIWRINTAAWSTDFRFL